MTVKEKLNFSQFYLQEFYDAVDNIAKTRFNKNSYSALNSLIVNLKSDWEKNNGVELLAREHGTSELSIFLYDIMDRIQDHPPTVVYDSMPEMVDDFVNTVEVMLEEDDTLKSLQKVNASFGESVPGESSSQSIEYSEFLHIEFNNVLEAVLAKQAKSDEGANLKQFIRILLENLQSPQLFNASEILTNLVENLNRIFVQPGSDISATQSYNNISYLMPELVKNTILLETESPETITESINKNTLIIAEPEVKKDEEVEIIEEPFEEQLSDETVPEEILKEMPADDPAGIGNSSSIENLLSAYFQSEIDEYHGLFEVGFERLKSDPQNIDVLEKLETKFHSFKEISMIHGYELLEAVCANVMQLLKGIRTKRLSIGDDFFVGANNLLEELKNSEKYKGKNKASEEYADLEAIVTKMEKSLDVADKKDRSEAEKPEVIVKKEEAVDQDIIETEREPEEALISFQNRKNLFTILKEVWFDLQPKLSELILEKRDLEKSIKVINKLISAAELIKLENLSNFFVDILKRLVSLKSLSENEINNGCAIIFIIQENVLSNIDSTLDVALVNKELQKFDTIFTTSIAFEDKDKLLSIILEFEKNNKANFKENFRQIIERTDDSVLHNQATHFDKLSKNLGLLSLENLREFPDYFSELFRSNSDLLKQDSVVNELDQSYKLFIENLEINKSSANTHDLVQTLKEVFSELDAKEQKETDIKPQSEELENEIPEEDLEQIFKDEAKNYVWKIEDALALLEADPKHKKPFEEIEKNAHSLKASARLMGYNDVTSVCASIENLADLFLNNNVNIEQDTIDGIKTSVNAILTFIDGDEKNLQQIIPELQNIESNIKSIVNESVKDEKTTESEEAEVKETPLFTDSESDDDLLSIFKEEASSFINIIENAIANLKDGRVNKEEIHQFEYASHSLKSAAKMLGFREIGQISDGLEQIAEALHKGEIGSTTHITDSLDNSLKAIKVLSAGEKIPASEITEIINLLDIESIEAEQKESEEVKFDKKQKVSQEIDPMVDLFLKEAWEMIEKINRDLIQFEKNHDKSLIENLNRNVHTLKGSAQMMQFEKIGNIAHLIEDFLEEQIENNDTISEDQLQPIFNAFDEIQIIMESIKSGEGEVSEKYDNIINVLKNINTATEPDIGQTGEETKKEEKKSEIIVEPISSKTESLGKIEKDKPKKSIADENLQQIKISTERVDNLINMAAELVINKTQLVNYVESLKKLGLDLDKDRRILKDAEYSLDDIILKRKYEEELKSSTRAGDEGGKKFKDLSLISNDFKKTINTIDTVSSKFYNLTHGFEQNIGRLAHLIKMLHDDVLQVRMVPVDNLFNRFPRAVRDLAKKQKKKVNLVVEGSNTEMDRAMIESLTDPLMHLVRNSIDHGIELPMHRKRAGKENTGNLRLRAKQDKNQIIIEVEDDGRGIDVEAVRKAIISKKILSKEKVGKLSKGEILDYIFYPGFSTKKDTSKVSGRGIGLDVVASQVDKLKGDIRVNSTTGQGTTFSIRVPLTLIISQAMLFRLTNQILAVPIISVEESIQFNKSVLQKNKDKIFINHQGEKIPAINLNHLLNFSEADLKKDLKALVIQETGIRCALLVDEVLHREEIVIKSLGSHLQNLDYISGGTILGDGSIALILDTTAIIRKIEKENLQKEKIEVKDTVPQPETEEVQKIKIEMKEIKDRKPIALIVDDSVSVRRFVANTLEKNNYETVLASDGINALEEIKSKSFDIVITDLEMPKMHGYELIEKIRAQKKLKDLPIVILTGRAGKKHKDMGIKLGANAFIVKPFKDNDLLSTLKKFIDN